MKSEGTLADLLDPGRVAGRIQDLVEGDSAARLRDLLVRCAQRLHDGGVPDNQPVHAFFVPGRIELLGKHTDYAGGRSLLAAIERGICLTATPRQDEEIRVADALSGQCVSFRASPHLQPEARWPNYPQTVVRRVARNFPGQVQGASIAFASDLPRAAGMSSSSALVIAVFLALSAVNDLASTESYRDNIRTTEELADYLAAVESGRDYRAFAGDLGVGTQGGSQDHTAILCARPGELVQYAFAPVRFERSVPLPAGYTFAVGVSGVRAEKTGAARRWYNQAAEQMRVINELWRAETGREDPSIGAALDADPAAADRLRGILRHAGHPNQSSESLLARLDQFIGESFEIIPASVDALARGDLGTFGTLVDRSQELAITALQNQMEETIHLARSARTLGAVAASAFGAGFGGSVWALVEEVRADAFLASWRSDYLTRFSERAAAATFFSTRAAAPAVRLA
ncbi:galactokinase family protein [soil metagenome]